MWHVFKAHNSEKQGLRTQYIQKLLHHLFLTPSVSTVTAPGGRWRVCFSRCGLSPAVGLCSRLKRADNSLQVTTERPLISQTQSQINGLVAEFRCSIFSDNKRLSRALLGEILFKHKEKKSRKRKVKTSHVCKGTETKPTNQIHVLNSWRFWWPSAVRTPWDVALYF